MKPLAAAAFSAVIALASPFATPVFAEPLPQGDPAALGFDPERLAAIDSRLTAAIEAGDMPGASILIARHGEIVHASTLGKVAPDGPPMARDTIFRNY